MTEKTNNKKINVDENKKRNIVNMEMEKEKKKRKRTRREKEKEEEEVETSEKGQEK